MIQSLCCPEEGCEVFSDCWVPSGLIHQTQYDAERACPKHKEKYRKLYEEWKKASAHDR
jgi:hypothetical protein